jgi:hypothetical protein
MPGRSVRILLNGLNVSLKLKINIHNRKQIMYRDMYNRKLKRSIPKAELTVNTFYNTVLVIYCSNTD